MDHYAFTSGINMQHMPDAISFLKSHVSEEEKASFDDVFIY